MTDPALRQKLDLYRAEVERWNRQINLVSRRGGPRALTQLIEQTVAAFEVLWPALSGCGAGAAPLAYIDLGSGAGLPGFPWHVILAQQVVSMETVLVEPRDKRAWFLERLPAVTGAAPWTVACGRWGRIAHQAALTGPGFVLVSLKALHLVDDDVLHGLGRLRFGGAPLGVGTLVAVARFVPPGSVWTELSGKVGAAEPGLRSRPLAADFRAREGRVLASTRLTELGASLSLSLYELTP